MHKSRSGQLYISVFAAFSIETVSKRVVCPVMEIKSFAKVLQKFYKSFVTERTPVC